MEPTGFVYILSNATMPGLVKIGQTTRSVATRAAEISAHEGVPAPFTIEAYFVSRNPAVDESRVHAQLASCRQPRREFFGIELIQAFEVVQEICGRPPEYCRPELYTQTRAARAAQEAKAAELQRAREAQTREAAAASQRAKEQWKQLSVLGKIAAFHIGHNEITFGDKLAAAGWLVCVIIMLAVFLGIIR